MASNSVPAGTKRGGDVSGCRSLNPEPPPHPSDHSLLTFVLPQVLTVTMRRIDFPFQQNVSVCGAPCHASYLHIGKIGLLLKHGLPLGCDSHHPQSHCPHHLFSRRREQERPRSSLPPLSSSTLAYPQLEPALKVRFKSSNRITSDPGHLVLVFSFAWREHAPRPRINRGVL